MVYDPQQPDQHQFGKRRPVHRFRNEHRVRAGQSSASGCAQRGRRAGLRERVPMRAYHAGNHGARVGPRHVRLRDRRQPANRPGPRRLLHRDPAHLSERRVPERQEPTRRRRQPGSASSARRRLDIDLSRGGAAPRGGRLRRRADGRGIRQPHGVRPRRVHSPVHPQRPDRFRDGLQRGPATGGS